mgnify:CR=1 FL=1
MFRSLFKNYLSLLGGEAFSKLVVFAAFVYLARLVGPANFGHAEWAAAVLMCAGLVVDNGLNSYGAREIAKNPERTVRLAAEIVTARFVLAAVSYFILTAVAVRFVRERIVAQLLLVFGLSLWGLPLLLNWVFQGHDRMRTVALTQMIRHTVFALTVFAFVRGADSLVFFAAAEVAGVASAAAFSVWMFRRSFADGKPFRPAFSTKLFREGLPIGMSQMFWVAKMYGATLIFGLIATPEETGYFAAAMRVLIGLHAFVWLYYLNLLPSMARAWQKGREPFAELIGGSMRIVVLLCLAGASLWIGAAPYAITLAYGEKFAGGIGALRWLAGVCAAAALSGHFRFGLIAAGHQSREMMTAALGAVLAAFFIPLGYYRWGTSGAAAGLCAAEILVLLCAWLIARRTLFGAEAAQAEEGSLKGLPETVG